MPTLTPEREPKVIGYVNGPMDSVTEGQSFNSVMRHAPDYLQPPPAPPAYHTCESFERADFHPQNIALHRLVGTELNQEVGPAPHTAASHGMTTSH